MDNKIYLELGIGPLLFSKYHIINEDITYRDNLVSYSTYKLLTSRLATHIKGDLPITIKTIQNNFNLFMLSIEVENLIKFITIDNQLISIIINMDSINILDLYELMYDYSREVIQSHKYYYDDPSEGIYNVIEVFEFDYMYNNENKQMYYEDFLKRAKIGMDRHKPTRWWMHMQIENYQFMAENRKVQVYGRIGKEGNHLIGFNISKDCNYFIHKIKNKTKDIDIKDFTITKLKFFIDNEEYTIDLLNRMHSSLRLYIDFITKFDSLDYIKTDEYIIVSNDEDVNEHGIYGIACTYSGLNKISMENNIGEKINPLDYINKMVIMGVESLNIGNITLYTTPDKIGLFEEDKRTYTYAIKLA